MVVMCWIVTIIGLLQLAGIAVIVKVLYAILETKVYIERLVNEEKWV